MKKIYLDHAATTPVKESVIEEMQPFFSERFGNPSSVHRFGQEAVMAIDKARKKVAHFLGAKEREVGFTSSATEANNLSVLGAAGGGHVVTSSIEHSAVLNPCKMSSGSVTQVPVSSEGVLRVEDVLKEIRSDTTLVSVMYVNNEIGTVQPIAEIGKAIGEINKKRKKKILFHTDAVQAANYLSCDVSELSVDLLTLSGHKIYGPKGVGALYIREGVTVSPVMYGASHERGLHPGTENVPAIVGMGKAVEEIDFRKGEEVKRLRDKVIDEITSSISGVTLNGSREKRIPNNVNLAFEGVEGESLLISLDSEGIAVSTGSACASHSLSPSHVLLAIGLSDRMAHGSLRISLGNETTEEEVDHLISKLPPIIKRLREISGR